MRRLVPLLLVLQACGGAPGPAPTPATDIKTRLREVERAIDAVESKERARALLRAAARVELALGEDRQAVDLLRRITPAEACAKELYEVLKQATTAPPLRESLLAALEGIPQAAPYFPAAYASCGRDDDVNRLVQGQRDPWAAVHMASDAYVRRGRPVAVLVLVRQAVDARPDDAEVLRVAERLAASGFFAEAISVATEVVSKLASRDEGIATILEYAASDRRVLDHARLAERIFEPDAHVRALAALAVGFAKAGQPDDALWRVTEGDRLLAARKDDLAPEAYVARACDLAKARSMACDQAGAMEALRALESLAARVAKEDALVAYACALYEVSPDAASMSYIERMPKDARAFALESVGHFHLARREVTQAIDAFRRLPVWEGKAAGLLETSRLAGRDVSVGLLREAMTVLDRIAETDSRAVGWPESCEETLVALGAFEPKDALALAATNRERMTEMWYVDALIGIARQHASSLAEHVAPEDRVAVELGRLAGEAGR